MLLLSGYESEVGLFGIVDVGGGKAGAIRIFAYRVQAPRIFDTVESGFRVAVQGFRCLTDCEFRPRERHFCGKRLVLIL